MCEFALGGREDAGGFGGPRGRAEERFCAGDFGQCEHVLAVTIDADALQFAQFGGFAAHALERVEQFALLGVGREAQLLDGVVDAPRLGLFIGRGTQRTLAQRKEQWE